MHSVLINNVPEETHRVLRRGAEALQSLQEYLRSWLIDEASRPAVREVLERVDEDARGTVSFADAVKVVRADRDRR